MCKKLYFILIIVLFERVGAREGANVIPASVKTVCIMRHINSDFLNELVIAGQQPRPAVG